MPSTYLPEFEWLSLIDRLTKGERLYSSKVEFGAHCYLKVMPEFRNKLGVVI